MFSQGSTYQEAARAHQKLQQTYNQNTLAMQQQIADQYGSSSGIGSIVEYRGEKPVLPIFTPVTLEGASMFNLGDIVVCQNSVKDDLLTAGNEYEVFKHKSGELCINNDNGKPKLVNHESIKKHLILKSKEKPSMFKSISQDLKKFVIDHKSTIYVLAVLVLVDHFLFQGAFRERLHGLMNKMLGKVEAMLDKKHE